MNSKKMTYILILLFVLIISLRFTGVKVLKFSLSLDSVYLQIVDIFSKLEDDSVDSIFNPNIDISLPLNGIGKTTERKHSGSFFDIFSGKLLLTETDYQIHPHKETDINPLSFQRSYNSFYANKKTSLGFGWRPFWDVKFYMINDLYVFETCEGNIITFNFIPKENKYQIMKNGWMNYKLEFISDINAYNIKSKNGQIFQFKASSDSSNVFPLKKIIHSTGRAYDVEWGNNGLLQSITEETTLRQTKYIFDSNNKVINSVIFPSGAKLQLEYDEMQNLSKVKNDTGNYNKSFEYASLSKIHLLTGLGNAEIIQKFKYEKDRVIEISNGEGFGKITINRDTLLGQCQIITMNEAVFKYSNTGDLSVKIEGPLEYLNTILFDEQGMITKITDAQNLSCQFIRDKNFNLIQKQNTNNGMEIFDYDQDDNLRSYTDTLGNVTQFQHTKNLLTRKVTPNGDIFKFSYNGNLLESYYCENDKSKVLYRYDDSGNLIFYQDENFSEIFYKYNPDGYLIEKASSNSWTEYYQWQWGKISQIYYEFIDSNKKLFKEYVYDSNNNVENVIDVNGNKKFFEYDKMGNIAKITDNQTISTTLKWSGDGLLKRIDSSNGRFVTLTYDLLNRPLEILTDNNLKYQFKYNKSNGINIFPFCESFSEMNSSDAKSLKIKYNDAYLIQELEKSSGLIENFEYDLEGNLISKITNNNRNFSYYYDKNNHLEYIYDKLNNKVFICPHDWRNNLQSFTFPDGNTYAISYDLKGLPSGLKFNLEEPFVKWDWNDEMNLSQINYNDTQTKKLFYNRLNLVSGEYEYKKGFTEYSYFPTGNLQSRMNSDGEILKFTYFNNNNLQTKELVNSETTYQWVYDSLNRVSRVEGVAPYQFTWSDEDNLIKLTYDKKNILLIAYDQSQAVSEKTYPGLLKQVNKYNAKGQIINISENGLDPIVYEYNTFGNLAFIKFPNNTTTKYEYDEQNRITDISTYFNTGNKILFKRTYSYDSLGNITQTDTERGSIKRTYDKLGRIKSEQLDDKDSTLYNYEYNDKNQIDTMTFENSSQKYKCKYVYESPSGLLKRITVLEKTPPAQVNEENVRINVHGIVVSDPGFLEIDNQVVQLLDKKFRVSNVLLKSGLNKIKIHSISSSGREKNYTIDFYYEEKTLKAYSYTNAGKINFLSEGGNSLNHEYNSEGLAKKITFSLGLKLKTISYEYYANQTIASKTNLIEDETPEIFTYIFDENDNLIGEFIDKKSGYENLYMYSPKKELVYSIARGHKKNYYHLDKDGSVIGITDNTGKILCSYSYDAFGKISHIKQNTYNPFLYLGHFYDNDTGLYFHKGFTGTDEEHAINFNASTNANCLKSPLEVFKTKFPIYYEEYPYKNTPEQFIYNIKPSDDFSFPTMEELQDIRNWICKK
ncbi:MAG: YD repeat-containing protein [uncultured bacterium]|nr:MAG: YD repeat-containing protein [uncultured bacterium]